MMIKPKVRRQQLLDFIADADTRTIDDHGSMIRRWHWKDEEGNLTLEECLELNFN